MAKKFVKVTGLHNAFVTNGNSLDTQTIKAGLETKANNNSILFIDSDSDDVAYGYEANSHYIWSRGVLFNQRQTPFVDGTVSNNNWNGKIDIDHLHHSQVILYRLNGDPGSGDASAVLSTRLDAEATKDIYYKGTQRVTNQFHAGDVVPMIYLENVVIGSTQYTGWWILQASGEDTKVRATEITTDGTYPVLACAQSDPVSGTAYESIYDSGFKINPYLSSLMQGINTKASGYYSHAEGGYTEASGRYSHATGYGTVASGNNSYAEGESTVANGYNSHAEGSYTKAAGSSSHAEGGYTEASGRYSHAEGESTVANGYNSHAEGESTVANGYNSHAEGGSTTASGQGSHAEGYSTTASGDYSHAEGNSTTASGDYSHAEGGYTEASGDRSHAEGDGTISTGYTSHTEGCGRQYTSAFTFSGPANVCQYTTNINHNLSEGSVVRYKDSSAKILSILSNISFITDRTLSSYRSVYEEHLIIVEGGVAYGDYSHAEGKGTNAIGEGSHAEGRMTEASGWYSHAEGYRTQALGDHSHAEGSHNVVQDSHGHAEGLYTSAAAKAHAEGHCTDASGNTSHAEGSHTTAIGRDSHAEGLETTAYGDRTHAEGKSTCANGDSSHSEGNHTITKGGYSHAEGFNTITGGRASHAEGSYTVTEGNDAHAEGHGLRGIDEVVVQFTCSVIDDTEKQAIKNRYGIEFMYCNHDDSFDDGYGSQGYIYSDPNCTNLVGIIKVCKYYSVGDYSGDYFNLIQGTLNNNTPYYWKRTCGALANHSHAEGFHTEVSGMYSHVEGYLTTASGDISHAEGESTVANGYNSHAEGESTVANGYNSHAEGQETTASGNRSHAEGELTTASGYSSHAEGQGTTASGYSSHAEGYSTTASGDYSHAEGRETTAVNVSEHAEGSYNSSHNVSTTYGDAGNTQHSIGIGSSDSARKNALEIMQNGDMYVYGIGNYIGINTKIQDNTIKPVQDVIVSSSSVKNIWTGTQAQYDVITQKDSNTLYIVL